MTRRDFLRAAPLGAAVLSPLLSTTFSTRLHADETTPKTPLADWLPLWKKHILDEAKGRPCDKNVGEELGWVASHILSGFAYGFLATRDPAWLDRAIDWTDACLRRAVKEPDGYSGWPDGDGGGGKSDEFDADSLLGEAMLFRPIIRFSAEILHTPALSEKYGEKARSYLTFAAMLLEKWQARDCWREVEGGGLWVVPAFGIDKSTGKWSAGYEQRKTGGFSNPANKQNVIACWHLELSETAALVEGRQAAFAEARRKAEQWWRLMKNRMRTREDGKYFVWNYWDPAGPWDKKPDGSLRHWVGVHPNGGYYGIDVDSIAAAFARGIVFTKEDIDRLVATNRDFMWDQHLEAAKFRRIDGEPPDARWKDSPGVLWTALAPYDTTLAKIFVANHNPDNWGGIAATPRAPLLLPALKDLLKVSGARSL